MIEVERSFNATDVKQIQVNIGLGDISARANGDGKIHVQARIRSNDEAELETTITDGVLKVSQRQYGGNGQSGDWFQPSSSLDVILIVPAGWDLPVTARTAACTLANNSNVAGAVNGSAPWADCVQPEPSGTDEA